MDNRKERAVALKVDDSALKQCVGGSYTVSSALVNSVSFNSLVTVSNLSNLVALPAHL